jgi:hypothetical protein
MKKVLGFVLMALLLIAIGTVGFAEIIPAYGP